MFFSELVPGKNIRQFAKGLLSSHQVAITKRQVEGVEIFPKQDSVGKGVGSLIRLPFGVHRKSGKRYGFYTPGGERLAPTLRDQLRFFLSPQTVAKPAFERYRSLTPWHRSKSGFLGCLRASGDLKEQEITRLFLKE